MQPRQSPLLPCPPRLSFPKCKLILTSSHSRGPRALGQGVRATVPCQHAASKCTLPKTRRAVSVPHATLGAKASESMSMQPPVALRTSGSKRKRSTSRGSVCTVTAVAATGVRVQGTRPRQTASSRVHSLPHANASQSRETATDREAPSRPHGSPHLPQPGGLGTPARPQPRVTAEAQRGLPYQDLPAEPKARAVTGRPGPTVGAAPCRSPVSAR